MSDISAIGATSTTPSSSSTESSAASQFSNPQMFLQLLVAELQNQDPTNPTDPSQIMQQTSELSQVEAVNSMSSAIAAEQSASQQNEATGLIGRTVTGSSNGSTISGTVSEVQLSAAGAPTLIVGGNPVALSSITDITA